MEYPAYKKLIYERIYTNALNLGEFYFFLLRKFNKQTADYWIEHLSFQLIDITQLISIQASAYKFNRKKEHLSYADCIGYISAQIHRLQFLTGDHAFAQEPNVTFLQ